MRQSLVVCFALCFAAGELQSEDQFSNHSEGALPKVAPLVEPVLENATHRTIDLRSLKGHPEGESTPPVSSYSKDGVVDDNPVNASFVDKLSHQVQVILKHFQEPEPIGIPGQNILSEPMSAPNTTGSMVVATGSFYNIAIWGLSNFSISSVDTRLDTMEVHVELRIKRVLIEGNYSVSNLLLSSAGPFTITLANVTATGTVDLETDSEGKLYANNSTIDMKYQNIEVVLQNISSILKPFVNTGAISVIESEKRHMLDNVNERLIVELNQRLAMIPKIPPLTQLSPVDFAVLEGRKLVRSRYEPFIISSVIDFENPFIKVHVGPVSVNGLSKFARIGNVSLSMANETVLIGIRVITGRLYGGCGWYYDFGQVGVKRRGQSNFTVSHLQVEAKINQSVDSRRPPRLEDLQVETGPIIVKMDGNGSFDYVVEMVVKMLPKMLRYVIIDALEEPLRLKVQNEVLDKISVEQVVEENLPEIKKYLADRL